MTSLLWFLLVAPTLRSHLQAASFAGCYQVETGPWRGDTTLFGHVVLPPLIRLDTAFVRTTSDRPVLRRGTARPNLTRWGDPTWATARDSVWFGWHVGADGSVGLFLADSATVLHGQALMSVNGTTVAVSDAVAHHVACPAGQL